MSLEDDISSQRSPLMYLLSPDTSVNKSMVNSSLIESERELMQSQAEELVALRHKIKGIEAYKVDLEDEVKYRDKEIENLKEERVAMRLKIKEFEDKLKTLRSPSCRGRHSIRIVELDDSSVDQGPELLNTDTGEDLLRANTKVFELEDKNYELCQTIEEMIKKMDTKDKVVEEMNNAIKIMQAELDQNTSEKRSLCRTLKEKELEIEDLQKCGLELRELVSELSRPDSRKSKFYYPNVSFNISSANVSVEEPLDLGKEIIDVQWQETKIALAKAEENLSTCTTSLKDSNRDLEELRLNFADMNAAKSLTEEQYRNAMKNLEEERRQHHDCQARLQKSETTVDELEQKVSQLTSASMEEAEKHEEEVFALREANENILNLKKESIKALEEELTGLNFAKEIIDVQLQETKVALAKAEGNLSVCQVSLQESNEKLETVSLNLSHLSAAKVEVEEELSKVMTALEEEKNQHQDCQIRLDNSEKFLEELERRVSEIVTSSMEEAVKHKEEVEALLETNANVLKDKDESMQLLEEKITSMNFEYKIMSKQYEETNAALAKAEENLSTSTTSLQGSNRELEQLRLDLSQIAAARALADSDLCQTKTSLEEERSQHQNCLTRLKESEKSIEQLEKAASELKNSLITAAAECSKYQAEVEDLRQANEIILKLKDEALMALEEEITTLKSDKDMIDVQLQETKIALVKTGDDLRVCTASLQESEGEQELLRLNLSELSAAKASLQEDYRKLMKNSEEERSQHQNCQTLLEISEVALEDLERKFLVLTDTLACKEESVLALEKEITDLNCAKETIDMQWQETRTALATADENLRVSSSALEDSTRQLEKLRLNLSELTASKSLIEDDYRHAMNSLEEMGNKQQHFQALLEESQNFIQDLNQEVSQLKQSLAAASEECAKQKVEAEELRQANADALRLKEESVKTLEEEIASLNSVKEIVDVKWHETKIALANAEGKLSVCQVSLLESTEELDKLRLNLSELNAAKASVEEEQRQIVKSFEEEKNQHQDCQTRLEKAEISAEELERKVSELSTASIKEAADHQAEVAALHDANACVVKDMEGSIKILKEELTSVSLKNQKMDEQLQETKDALAETKENLSVRTASLQESVEELEKLHLAFSELNAAKKIIEEDRREIMKRLELEKSQHQVSQEKFEVSVMDLEREVSELQTILKCNEESMMTLKEEISVLNSAKEHIELQWKETKATLTIAGEKLDVCTTSLQDSSRELGKLQLEFSELDAAKVTIDNEYRQTMKSLEEERKQLQDCRIRLEKSEKKVEELEREVSELRVSLSNSSEQMGNQKEKVNVLLQENSKLELEKEELSKRLQEEIASLRLEKEGIVVLKKRHSEAELEWKNKTVLLQQEAIAETKAKYSERFLKFKEEAAAILKEQDRKYEKILSEKDRKIVELKGQNNTRKVELDEQNEKLKREMGQLRRDYLQAQNCIYVLEKSLDEQQKRISALAAADSKLTRAHSTNFSTVFTSDSSSFTTRPKEFASMSTIHPTRKSDEIDRRLSSVSIASTASNTSTSSGKFKAVPTGSGCLFKCEDEEEFQFHEKNIADLKHKRQIASTRLPGLNSSGDRFEPDRFSELYRRNTMVPIHLKSCYPSEFITCDDTEVDENKLKQLPGYNRSTSGPVVGRLKDPSGFTAHSQSLSTMPSKGQQGRRVLGETSQRL